MLFFPASPQLQYARSIFQLSWLNWTSLFWRFNHGQLDNRKHPKCPRGSRVTSILGIRTKQRLPTSRLLSQSWRRQWGANLKPSGARQIPSNSRLPMLSLSSKDVNFVNVLIEQCGTFADWRGKPKWFEMTQHHADSWNYFLKHFDFEWFWVVLNFLSHFLNLCFFVGTGPGTRHQI